MTGMSMQSNNQMTIHKYNTQSNIMNNREDTSRPKLQETSSNEHNKLNDTSNFN